MRVRIDSLDGISVNASRLINPHTIFISTATVLLVDVPCTWLHPHPTSCCCLGFISKGTLLVLVGPDVSQSLCRQLEKNEEENKTLRSRVKLDSCRILHYPAAV